MVKIPPAAAMAGLVGFGLATAGSTILQRDEPTKLNVGLSVLSGVLGGVVMTASLEGGLRGATQLSGGKLAGSIAAGVIAASIGSALLGNFIANQ